MLKNKRGLSLTTMVITVMIMFIIMGALVYSAVDSVKVRKLNKFYDDLRLLTDSVEVYYLKNGKLPVDDSQSDIIVSKNDTKETVESNKISFVLKKGINTVTNQESFFNPNDYDVTNTKATYKYLKLSLLDNLSLNNKDNVYIINTQSHTIYNYTGLTIDKVTYNSLPLTYKDTKYNEFHPVTEIVLKSIPGVTETGSLYFSNNTDEINLRDYLTFTTDLGVNTGSPKDLTFSETTNTWYSVNKEGKVTIKKDASFSGATSQTITVSATNYGGKDNPSNLSVELKPSYIDIYKNGSEFGDKDVNIVKNTSSSTCINPKNSDTFEVQKYGALSGKTVDMTIIPENKDVVSGSFNKENSVLTVTSGSKTGKSYMTLQAENYGLPKDQIHVNVFNFDLYEGSAGSSTNITKLDLTGIGESSKTNVKLNVEAPSSFDFNGDTRKVDWSLVTDDKSTADNSEVVSISPNSGNPTVVTVTPLKPGKTNLKCVVTVDSEVLVTFVIPVTVSGIVNEDGSVIDNDTISFSSGNLTKNIKYVFGDSNIKSYSFDTPTVTVSNSFTVTKNEDNAFTVSYTGSSDVTATLTITATVRK